VSAAAPNPPRTGEPLAGFLLLRDIIAIIGRTRYTGVYLRQSQPAALMDDKKLKD
jgi:hypothetical protein